MTDSDLADLRHHWGEAYLIAHPEPDTWITVRRDDQATLRAGSPEVLRILIREDHKNRPVRRLLLTRVAPPQGGGPRLTA